MGDRRLGWVLGLALLAAGCPMGGPHGGPAPALQLRVLTVPATESQPYRRDQYLHLVAYRANVTGLVTGDATYTLSNFIKPGGIDVNGTSLVVFYNDGNAANNRDVVMFNGNDSNISNPFDADGWNITLAGINYSSGTASAQFHVSDGQTFTDDAVIANSTTLAPVGSVFDGNTVPNGPGGPSNGGLWDIKDFNVTSLLSPGPNSLHITTGVNGDCLSCVLIAIDLPAGAAPPDVPEPASLGLVGVALAGLAVARRRRKV